MIPQIRPEDAHQAMQDGALLLDVRGVDEWASARIPGAIHVPMQQVPQRIQELPKDRQVICQCASGGRSATVTQFLRQAGYDACNLQGGIGAWAAAGLPVVR